MERKRKWKQKLLAFILSFAVIATMMPVVTGDSLVMEADAANVKTQGDRVAAIALDTNGMTLVEVQKHIKEKGYSSWKAKYKKTRYEGDWCAWFISNCARAAGVSQSIFPNDTFASHVSGTWVYGGFYGWAKENGILKTSSSYTPKVGDICFMQGSEGKYGHVEIVYKVKGNTIYTIGGNSGLEIWSKSTVKKRSFTKGTVAQAYAAIKYKPLCSHSSTRYDACTSCGEAVVDYAANKTKYSYSSMNAAYTTTAAATLHKTPYTGNKKGSRKVSSGKILRIVASLKNTNGEQWYKVADNGTARYVKASYVRVSTAASTLRINMPDVSITKGKPKDITGTISGNYAIKSISYVLKEPGKNNRSAGGRFSTGLSVETAVAVKSSFINEILCGKLKNTSTLTVTAKDISGKTVTKDVTLKVSGSAEKIRQPQITYHGVDGGKQVTIKQLKEGATLKYSYGSTTKTTKSSSVSFVIKTSATVTAVSSKSGCIASDKRSLNIEVRKLSKPSIKTEQQGNEVYVRITDADKKAELYYAVDGGYKKYKGAFKVDEECTVSAYAKRKGYNNSDTSSADVEFQKPSAPKVKIMNEDSNIAVGKSLSVCWEQDKKAVSSTAKLYYEGNCIQELETDKSTAVFALNETGEYSVSVTSKNAFGESEESDSVEAVAKEPLTVVFRDAAKDAEEGEILASVKVEYGDMLDIIQEPARKGYNFTGWENASTGVVSTNGYTKIPVKEDITYTATYTKKTYTVKFYDTDGTLADTQTVKYGEEASDQKAIAQLKKIDDNHYFVGWSVIRVSDEGSSADIKKVDTDMSLQAIVKWKESDLPVSITVKSADQNPGGMSIHPVIDIATDETKEFSFYLIAALKAEKNGVEKTVYVDRQIFTKEKDSTGFSIGEEDSKYSFDLKTTGVDLSGVTRIEVMALECNEDNTTGGAYSKAASLNVDYDAYWSELSEWTEEKPEAKDNRVIEDKLQYRGSKLETKYSSAASLSSEGYVKARTEYYNESTGKWSTTKTAAYGRWRASAPSTGTTDKGTYKIGVSKESKSVNRSYAYYCDCRKVCWKTSGGVCKYCGGKTKNLLTVYSEKSITATGYTKDSSDGSYTFPASCIETSSPKKLGQIYCITYKGSQVSSFTSKAVTGRVYLWSKADGTVYRTKTVKDRNVFTRYSKPGAWSDSKPAADKIETRTVYRYTELISSPETKPEVKGENRHFEGKMDVGENIEGKAATVMIYQANNFDPNRYQLQYVDQISIGENNSYSFDYILKEEPTVASGNYIVSLGVEGSTGLVTVGTIEAPKKEYSVSLCYEDENHEKQYILKEQMVREHEDVDMTGIEIPEREGYYFVGWDQRTTDVTADCEIKAVYVPMQNAVVFVDWVKQTVDMQRALTGETVTAPGAGEDMPGYTFKGWKLKDGTIVEADGEIAVNGDMVVTAEYDVKTYTVKFMGADGTTAVSEQTVEYGAAANPPETVEVENGEVFLGWSDEHTWWNVSEDMEVKPVIAYDRTASTPEAVIDEVDDYIDSDLELKAEDGAKIYYTTDGTDPQIPDANGNADSGDVSTKEYDGNGLNFTEDTIIKAVSSKEGKNTSEILEVYFEYSDEDEEYNPDTVWEEIGEYNVVAEPGKEITLNLKMNKNPGLTGYHFLVECDRGVFYADYDEENGLVCEPGEASANGNIFASDYEDLGWQILWFATEENKTDGSLFKLKLKVAEEDVEAGVYPVKISYAKANTFTGEEVEANIGEKIVSLEVESDTELLGDANGDGSVTTMDVLRIARYVVGLADIDENRKYLADVNCDGSITIADAILLARNIIGLEQIG